MSIIAPLGGDTPQPCQPWLSGCTVSRTGYHRWASVLRIKQLRDARVIHITKCRYCCEYQVTLLDVSGLRSGKQTVTRDSYLVPVRRFRNFLELEDPAALDDDRYKAWIAEQDKKPDILQHEPGREMSHSQRY